MVMMWGRTLILQLNIENVIGACNRADGDDGREYGGGDDGDKNYYNDSLFVKLQLCCKGSNFYRKCTNIARIVNAVPCHSFN